MSYPPLFTYLSTQQTGCGKRHYQLQQIKVELRFPYRDRRPPFVGHSEEKIFELLSGETDATLRPGLPVTGRVLVSVDERMMMMLATYLSTLLISLLIYLPTPVQSVNDTSARVKLDQLTILGYLHR